MEIKHIADIIYSRLVSPGDGKGESNVPAVPKKVQELSKKIFLSDWEIKKLYNKERKEIIVPLNAVLSPLSLDWIEYNNVIVSRKKTS